MTKRSTARFGAIFILLAGITIGYIAAGGGVSLTEFAGAQAPATADSGTSTKNDPSLTPWKDPDDPYVIRLNREDQSIDAWKERNSKPNPQRDAGPIDLQRYAAGFDYTGFPTFFKAPIH